MNTLEQSFENVARAAWLEAYGTVEIFDGLKEGIIARAVETFKKSQHPDGSVERRQEANAALKFAVLDLRADGKRAKFKHTARDRYKAAGGDDADFEREFPNIWKQNLANAATAVSPQEAQLANWYKSIF